MAHLVVAQSTGNGQIFPLSKHECVIGREKGCDIRLVRDQVSRRHVAVRLEGRHFVVADLGSRNGTKLNGSKLQQVSPLNDGDEIQLGGVSVRFHDSISPILEKAESGSKLVFDQPGQNKPHISHRLAASEALSSHDARAYKGLFRIAEMVGQFHAPEEMMPQLLEEALGAFPQSEFALLALCEEGEITPAWTKSRNDATSDGQKHLSVTIIEHVVSSKEAVLSMDVAHDGRFVESESLMNFRIRSVIAAPMFGPDGEIVGVLQLDSSDRSNAFRGSDLRILSSMASQAAVALSFARAHQESIRQRVLERDLEFAAEIQRGLLPESPPYLPGHEFADFYRPADQIGGDYFDYIPLPDGRIGVVIADVSGHGVAAAITMARLSAEIRYFTVAVQKPTEILDRLNAATKRLMLRGKFVTILVAVVDQDGTIELAGAGHLPPLLRRVDGTISEVSAAGFGPPVGVTDTANFCSVQLALEPGDALMLYTDGITEAVNSTGQMYGMERLAQVAQQRPPETVATSSQWLVDQVVKDVVAFTDQQLGHDDVSVVAIRRQA